MRLYKRQQQTIRTTRPGLRVPVQTRTMVWACRDAILRVSYASATDYPMRQQQTIQAAVAVASIHSIISVKIFPIPGDN